MKYVKRHLVIAFNYYCFQLLDALRNVLKEYKEEISTIIKTLQSLVKQRPLYAIYLVKTELIKNDMLSEWLSKKQTSSILELYGSIGDNPTIRRLVIVWSLLSDKNKGIIWEYIDIMIKIIKHFDEN
jgi:hypothetical protein